MDTFMSDYPHTVPVPLILWCGKITDDFIRIPPTDASVSEIHKAYEKFTGRKLRIDTLSGFPVSGIILLTTKRVIILNYVTRRAGLYKTYMRYVNWCDNNIEDYEISTDGFCFKSDADACMFKITM